MKRPLNIFMHAKITHYTVTDRWAVGCVTASQQYFSYICIFITTANIHVDKNSYLDLWFVRRRI